MLEQARNNEMLRRIARKAFPSIQQLASKAGFSLRRKNDCAVRISDLLCFLRESDDISILQVGAHDGQANDPLNDIRRARGCHGFAIEANPRVFPKLCDTLHAFPSITPLNLAISDVDGDADFYIIRDPASTRQPFWASQVSSLDKGYLERTLCEWGHAESECEALIECVHVPCSSFTTLIEANRIQKIDVLAMDIEGLDFALLKTFPFEVMRPEAIIFESNHMNADERLSMPHFLAHHGYSFIEIGIDVFCRRWHTGVV